MSSLSFLKEHLKRRLKTPPRLLSGFEITIAIMSCACEHVKKKNKKTTQKNIRNAASHFHINSPESCAALSCTYGHWFDKWWQMVWYLLRSTEHSAKLWGGKASPVFIASIQLFSHVSHVCQIHSIGCLCARKKCSTLLPFQHWFNVSLFF